MKHSTLSLILAFVGLMVWQVQSQPTPAPTSGDAPCEAAPNASQQNDTVVSQPGDWGRDEGFYSLFNGSDFTGWWQSCQTSHSSSNRSQGAIFRVDGQRGYIYSTQRGNAGGVLMTKKRYTHYEIIFDYWPDFGNDGGIFHRTPENGRCFQTVLDYINGASLGGTWGEGGYANRDYRPFSFGGNENSITIPGNSGGDFSNWTIITRALNPTSFGCPSSGCTQTEYRNLWDQDDFNQLRIKFYGGVTTATTVKMKSYMRKIIPNSTNFNPWVPILQDTTLRQATPAAFIGLQVHGGGRFGGPRGTWYGRIVIRELDENGIPLEGPPDPELPEITTVPVAKTVAMTAYNISASSKFLSGNMKLKHEIVLRDLKGKVLDTFSGKAGKFQYSFTSKHFGTMAMEVKTPEGTQYSRIYRGLN